MKYSALLCLFFVVCPATSQVVILNDGSRLEAQLETWGADQVDIIWMESGERLRLKTDSIQAVVQQDIVPRKERLREMVTLEIDSSPEHPVWNPELGKELLRAEHSWGQTNEKSPAGVRSLRLPVPVEQWKLRGPVGKDGWISFHGPGEPADFASEWGWVRGKLVRHNTLFQHIRHPLGVLPARCAVRFRMMFPEGVPTYELYLHKGASPFQANALIRYNFMPGEMRLLPRYLRGR